MSHSLIICENCHEVDSTANLIYEFSKCGEGCYCDRSKLVHKNFVKEMNKK